MWKLRDGSSKDYITKCLNDGFEPYGVGGTSSKPIIYFKKWTGEVINATLETSEPQVPFSLLQKMQAQMYDAQTDDMKRIIDAFNNQLQLVLDELRGDRMKLREQLTSHHLKIDEELFNRIQELVELLSPHVIPTVGYPTVETPTTNIIQYPLAETSTALSGDIEQPKPEIESREYRVIGEDELSTLQSAATTIRTEQQEKQIAKMRAGHDNVTVLSNDGQFARVMIGSLIYYIDDEGKIDRRDTGANVGAL